MRFLLVIVGDLLLPGVGRLTEGRKFGAQLFRVLGDVGHRLHGIQLLDQRQDVLGELFLGFRQLGIQRRAVLLGLLFVRRQLILLSREIGELLGTRLRELLPFLVLLERSGFSMFAGFLCIRFMLLALALQAVLDDLVQLSLGEGLFVLPGLAFVLIIAGV